MTRKRKTSARRQCPPRRSKPDLARAAEKLVPVEAAGEPANVLAPAAPPSDVDDAPLLRFLIWTSPAPLRSAKPRAALLAVAAVVHVMSRRPSAPILCRPKRRVPACGLCAAIDARHRRPASALRPCSQKVGTPSSRNITLYLLLRWLLALAHPPLRLPFTHPSTCPRRLEALGRASRVPPACSAPVPLVSPS